MKFKSPVMVLVWMHHVRLQPTTDMFCQDALSLVAIGQCNTSVNRIDDASMPSTDPVSLASRQPEFETELVRRSFRQVRLLSKLKDFEV